MCSLFLLKSLIRRLYSFILTCLIYVVNYFFIFNLFVFKFKALICAFVLFLSCTIIIHDSVTLSSIIFNYFLKHFINRIHYWVSISGQRVLAKCACNKINEKSIIPIIAHIKFFPFFFTEKSFYI